MIMPKFQTSNSIEQEEAEEEEMPLQSSREKES